MKIAVVDDNIADRTRLSHYIKNICNELNCEIEVSTYSSGESFLENEDVPVLDVVFLDIYMGMKTGMEVAKTLRKRGYLGMIIFCTTTADFALEGYSVKALGYIVKPFTYEKIVELLKDILKTRSNETSRFIRLKDGGHWYRVNLSDVLYAEKQGNYVCIHTFSKNYSTRMSLGEIEEQLFQYNCFIKCDRGIVVNLENVQEVQENTILLKNNAQVPISRSNKAKVNNRYFDFIFEKMG